MLGLVIKDLLVSRKYGKTLLVFLILYGIWGFFLEDATFIVSLLCVMLIMMSIATFSYDEMAKWDRYAMTMPIGRRRLVLAKYLTGAICLGSGVLVGMVYMALYSILKPDYHLTGGLLLIAGVLVGGFLYLCVVLPLVFRFGTEKSRIMMIALIMVPILAVVGLEKAGVSFAGIPLTTVVAIAVGIILFVPPISYLISCRIVAKKEF